MSDRILVTGATGRVGSLVLKLLRDRGHDAIGLSRKIPENAFGAWRQADFEDSDTMAVAMQGIDRVFLASSDHPAQDALEQGVIDACIKGSVRHIVKLSAQSATLRPPVSFGRLHRASELTLERSGIAHTNLQPTFFMQSIELFVEDIRKGRLIAPTGNGAVAMVDTADVADVAATILAAPTDHAGQSYVLTGPRALRFADVAQRLSNLTGRTVRHISPPGWLARLVLPIVSPMPRWQSDLAVELMQAIGRGAQSTVTDSIAKICEREPGDLDSWLEQTAERFAPRKAVVGLRHG